MKGKIVKIEFSKAEKIQDLNCAALASIRAEHKLLHAIRDVIRFIDKMDGVMKNEPHLEYCKKLLKKAISQNKYQHLKDHSEKVILENVIPLFEEWIPNEVA